MAFKNFQILSKTFSTSTYLNARIVKPPVQVHGKEGLYATALFSAATKKKALPAVEKDLIIFQQKLREDSRLSDFLLSPLVKKGLKAEGISGACTKLKMNPLTANLLTTMVENGRHQLIHSVIVSFSTIMAASRGEVVCEVITAKPLDQIMRNELNEGIKLFLKKGETSKIAFKVDPTIIGGMVVSIGDKYADMSISSKLKKYSDLINTPA